MRVNISNHAYDRWIDYCNYMKRSKLAALVERHLYAALRQGVPLESEAIQLEINHKVKAVVVPGKYYGWDVVTFYLREEAKKEVIT